MTHRYHPDPNRDDPPEGILFDDCEDCAGKADTLTGLDSENALLAVRRARTLARDGLDFPISSNEALLLRRLYAAEQTLVRGTGLQ